MAIPIPTKGTTFEIETATPDTYVAIGRVNSAQWAPAATAKIPTTHLGSTVKESMLDLPDNGQFTMNVQRNDDDTGHARVATLRDDQSEAKFRWTLSSGHVYSCAVVTVSNFTMGLATSDKVLGDITLELSAIVVKT